MNTTDSAVRAHLIAAAELVQLALADAREENAKLSENIARAMSSGAMLTLRTTLTTTDMAFLSIDLTTATGESLLRLMSLELQHEDAQ